MKGMDTKTNSTIPRFPLFISMEGEETLVVGGGPIAARRAGVLLDFGAAVTVVSPEISEDMRTLMDRLIWRQEKYTSLKSLDKEYVLVVAATNDRAVNKKIGEDASRLHIPVSVADRKEESTFWFPAIMRGGGLAAGLVSEDGDHGAVKAAAAKIRKILEEEL